MARNSPPRNTSITFNDQQTTSQEPGKSGSAAFIDLDKSRDESAANKSPPKRSPSQGGSPNKSKGNSPTERRSPTERSPSQSPSQQRSSTNTSKPENKNYVPSPYTFRAPLRLKHQKRMIAKCPPFYLQLDHTLAVIWTLFSDDPPVPLGIAQLQWALNFLQGIYTRKGEHPKDVALCIQAIEDLLLVKYADMAQDVSIIEDEDRRRRMKKMLHRSESSMRSKASVCDSETCFAKMSLDVDRDIAEEVELEIKEMPFSVNYADMAEHANKDLDQVCSKQSKASTDVSGVDFPQENTMEFLEQWRSDQIHKIHAELQRLHSIEAYIGCAASNFDSIQNDVEKDDSTRSRPRKYYY